MKIVIIANFTRDFSETDNGRFLYLAKKLAADGHRVELITNDFNHGRKERRKPVTAGYSFKVTLLHEPGYKKNVSIQRFNSHRIWGKNVRKYLETIDRPDVVYCAVPSLTGPGYAASYCRKNGIRFLIDIQDLWPEAFQTVLHIPVLSSLLFYPFKRKADYVYSCADSICAVSETYTRRALRVNPRCKTGTTVFLGTNVALFDKYSQQTPLYIKPDGELWLAYCGTLGSSYDLTCVFDALLILKEKGMNPKFIVMGNGPLQEQFEQYARENNIDTLFTGRLPYDQMCALLCTCDIAVNPIAHKAAQSITNKHGDYASSGLPVVSTQENEEYQALVDQYKMGFNCKNNDPDDLADKLEILLRDPELRRTMGANARKCAEERFDREHSYELLIGQITKKGT